MITPVVDLGGTIIKAGLVHDGRLLASSSMPARAGEGLGPQLGRIEKLLPSCVRKRASRSISAKASGSRFRD